MQEPPDAADLAILLQQQALEEQATKHAAHQAEWHAQFEREEAQHLLLQEAQQLAQQQADHIAQQLAELQAERQAEQLAQQRAQQRSREYDERQLQLQQQLQQQQQWADAQEVQEGPVPPTIPSFLPIPTAHEQRKAEQRISGAVSGYLKSLEDVLIKLVRKVGGSRKTGYLSSKEGNILCFDEDFSGEFLFLFREEDMQFFGARRGHCK